MKEDYFIVCRKVYLLSDKVIAQEFVREYDVLYKETCKIRGKAFE